MQRGPDCAGVDGVMRTSLLSSCLKLAPCVSLTLRMALSIAILKACHRFLLSAPNPLSSSMIWASYKRVDI